MAEREREQERGPGSGFEPWKIPMSLPWDPRHQKIAFAPNSGALTFEVPECLEDHLVIEHVVGKYC